MDKKSAELVKNMVKEDGNKIGVFETKNNNILSKTGQTLINDNFNEQNILNESNNIDIKNKSN